MWHASQAYVHLLPGLTRLAVSRIQTPAQQDHLDLMFSGLSHLQDCQMTFATSEFDEPPAELVFPTALLRCIKLTALSVGADGEQ